MKSKIIAIAGGTGSGKSVLTYALLDAYPNTTTFILLDDYHKDQEKVPKLHGITNWDHPNAVDFEKLVEDLTFLLNGKAVTLMTKNERDNPEYKKVLKMMSDKDTSTGSKATLKIPKTIEPKPIVILEGYMALVDERIRKLLTTSIFLELGHETRLRRRTKFIDEEYTKKVLIPMHEKYVEPTKKFADHLIDVSDLTKEEVFNKVKSIIKKYLV